MINNDIMKLLKECKEADCFDAFYNKTIWRKIRKEAKERDRNECQMCKRKGLHEMGTEVHHIVEIKDNLNLALELSNLTTLCRACHNRVHNRVSKIPYEKCGHDTSFKKEVSQERW